MGKGGSAPAQPTTQTVQQSNIPEYARPYFEDIMTRGQTVSQSEYQPYTGQRVAEFNPMQQQAFQGIQSLGPSPLIGAGAGLTGLAAGQAYQAGQYNPMQAQQFYQSPQFQGMDVNYLMSQAPNLQQYQMGPAERARTGSFAMPGTAEAYMSPYMQNVVDIQQREAQRQADIAGTYRGAQATGAGAFGGSRQAIMEAEAARNLAQQKGDIQAQGLQSAYQQAQQAYQTDAQRQLQAQLANQQAGLTVGGQNLSALLGVQQLGAQTGMQSQQLNQAAQLQAQQQALGQSQAQNMFSQQNAQLAAQYGLSGLQAAEQSRQFGAGLGMQGAGMLGQLGGQFGQLGQQAFGQDLSSLQAQQQAGAIQQAQEQQKMDLGYEEFMRQQLYPQSQLQFLSSLLRGSVVAPQQTMYSYQQQPSMASQIGGLGIGALGLSKAFSAKEGGEVPGYAVGGVTGSEGAGGYATGGAMGGGIGSFRSDIEKLRSLLGGVTDPLIARDIVRRSIADPLAKQVVLNQFNAAREGAGRQQALDRGIPQDTVLGELNAPGVSGLDAGVMENPVFAAAGGGIVAFQEGGAPAGVDIDALASELDEARARLNMMRPPGTAGIQRDPTARDTYRQAQQRVRDLETRWASIVEPQIPAARMGGLGAMGRALPQRLSFDVPSPAGIQAALPQGIPFTQAMMDADNPPQPTAQRQPQPQPRGEPGPARATATAAPAIKPGESEEELANRMRLMNIINQPDINTEDLVAKFRAESGKRFKDRSEEIRAAHLAEANEAKAEGNRDKWLAVSIAGFASAAGDSPSAFKNFAQGFGLGAKEAMAVRQNLRKAEAERKKAERLELQANEARQMELFGQEQQLRDRAEQRNLTRQNFRINAANILSDGYYKGRKITSDETIAREGLRSQEKRTAAMVGAASVKDPLMSRFNALSIMDAQGTLDAAGQAELKKLNAVLKARSEATKARELTPEQAMLAQITGVGARGVNLTPEQQKLLDKYK